MPLTDRAYFEGENLPRCAAKPTKADVAASRAMRHNTWECALPKGHEKFGNPRHHAHAWVQTGEDE